MLNTHSLPLTSSSFVFGKTSIPMSSKEQMLSPLSGSDPQPVQQQPPHAFSQHPHIIQTRPVNPNPNPNPLPIQYQHLVPPVPTTLNNININDNNNVSGGFSLVVSPSTAVDSTDSGGQKKKRGRPRKYDAEGNLRISYSTPPSVPQHPPTGFGVLNVHTASYKKVTKASMSSFSPGFGEMFAQTTLGEFTPHLVTVMRGEDVAAKILLLGQQGHKGICVLSAIGVVSNVTIRQPSCSGGILTYEGRFEILSLTGSYTEASTAAGGKSWVGALSVSLAGPDGRVVGGGLAGSMTAATPTQLVLGSFTPGGYVRQKRKYIRQQPRPFQTPMNTSDPFTVAKPISQAMPAEEAFQSQSSASLEHSHDEDDESNQPMQQQNAVPSHSMWSFGPSPDISLSIHGRAAP